MWKPSLWSLSVLIAAVVPGDAIPHSHAHHRALVPTGPTRWLPSHDADKALYSELFQPNPDHFMYFDWNAALHRAKASQDSFLEAFDKMVQEKADHGMLDTGLAIVVGTLAFEICGDTGGVPICGTFSIAGNMNRMGNKFTLGVELKAGINVKAGSLLALTLDLGGAFAHSIVIANDYLRDVSTSMGEVLMQWAYSAMIKMGGDEWTGVNAAFLEAAKQARIMMSIQQYLALKLPSGTALAPQMDEHTLMTGIHMLILEDYASKIVAISLLSDAPAAKVARAHKALPAAVFQELFQVKPSMNADGSYKLDFPSGAEPCRGLPPARSLICVCLVHGFMLKTPAKPDSQEHVRSNFDGMVAKLFEDIVPADADGFVRLVDVLEAQRFEAGEENAVPENELIVAAVKTNDHKHLLRGPVFRSLGKNAHKMYQTMALPVEGLEAALKAQYAPGGMFDWGNPDNQIVLTGYVSFGLSSTAVITVKVTVKAAMVFTWKQGSGWANNMSLQCAVGLTLTDFLQINYSFKGSPKEKDFTNTLAMQLNIPIKGLPGALSTAQLNSFLGYAAPTIKKVDIVATLKGGWDSAAGMATKAKDVCWFGAILKAEDCKKYFETGFGNVVDAIKLGFNSNIVAPLNTAIGVATAEEKTALENLRNTITFGVEKFSLKQIDWKKVGKAAAVEAAVAVVQAMLKEFFDVKVKNDVTVNVIFKHERKAGKDTCKLGLEIGTATVYSLKVQAPAFGSISLSLRQGYAVPVQEVAIPC